MPAAQSGSAGIARGHEVERGAEVVHLAAPVVERARARADAAEVEAQHGAADARQRLRRLVHRLRVHRAAVLRMRMREDDRGAQPPAAARRGRRAMRLERPAGSSSSASSARQPARDLAQRRGHRSRGLATNSRDERRRTRRGRVTMPRWPVRSSVDALGAGESASGTAASLPTGTTRSRSRLAGDDERRRGDARAVRARCRCVDAAARARPCAPATTGAPQRRVPQLPRSETPAAPPASGSAAAVPALQPQRRLGDETAARTASGHRAYSS